MFLLLVLFRFGSQRLCCCEKWLAQLPDTAGWLRCWLLLPASCHEWGCFSWDAEARVHRQIHGRVGFWPVVTASMMWGAVHELFLIFACSQSWWCFLIITDKKENWDSERVNKGFIIGLSKRKTDNSIVNLVTWRLLGTSKEAIWVEWQRWRPD